MKILDVDITQALRDALPMQSFLFNPSIAHVTGDTYIVSVRSYVHDSNKPLDLNPKLLENPQHPWGTEWDGHDVTYILPVVITDDAVTPIIGTGWPLTIPVQDTRIYKFYKDGTIISYILTFNERYEGYEDIMIKGGEHCDTSCYLIGWGYLVVDINTLEHSYTPGKMPLCTNISNPIEKNWSLWTYARDKKNLLLSYAIAPTHDVFSFVLKGIVDSEIVGGSDCRLETRKRRARYNIYGDLESLYGGNLLVSLSTPSYIYDDNVYQAVGHLKVKIDYIHSLAKSDEDTNLAEFAKEYINNYGKKHYNANYIYMMFLYRFEVVECEEGNIELTGVKGRINANITHTTPAFVNKVGEYDYFLNFPSGMVIDKDNDRTIISYGDGDATSHLLYIDHNDLDALFAPVKGMKAEDFLFLHGVKDDDGYISL